MSIEQLLADQTAALRENTEAIRANTAQLLVVDAGRAEALEQLKSAGTGGAAATTTRRRRAAADDAPAAEPTPTPAAAEPVTSSEPPADAFSPDTSDDAIRSMLTGWLKEDGISTEDTAARTANVKALFAHLGTPTAVGEKSTLDDDGRRQLVFFLTLFKAGLPVNFSADYDFAVDPLTQVPVSEIVSSDDDDDDLVG